MKKLKASALELQFENQVRGARLPEPVKELEFIQGRKWRFDFAWPSFAFAVEVNGGNWNQGRHNRGDGMSEDCRKLAEATLCGWSVIQVTGDMVRNGEAIKLASRFFENQFGEG